MLGSSGGGSGHSNQSEMNVLNCVLNNSSNVLNNNNGALSNKKVVNFNNEPNKQRLLVK
jgi:hypothetical protein